MNKNARAAAETQRPGGGSTSSFTKQEGAALGIVGAPHPFAVQKDEGGTKRADEAPPPGVLPAGPVTPEEAARAREARLEQLKAWARREQLARDLDELAETLEGGAA